MKRTQDKVARAAHIKPNTRGSSNEISFSVLDAAAGGGGRDGEDESSSFRKIPLYSLNDAPRTSSRGSSSWQAPADEVKRRKHTRRRRRFAAIAAIVCACVVVIGIATTAVLSFFHEQDTRKSELVGLLETIRACDDTMLSFDEMVSNQITREDVSLEHEQDIERAFSRLEPTLDSVAVTLATCKTQAEALGEELLASADKECVNEAIAAINARLNMLEIGRGILDDTLSAYIAAARAQEGWEALLSADADAREAASLLESMSKDSVSASLELSQTALNSFATAREEFNKAASFAEATMLPYIAYSQLRIDAQNAAIASDEAYLARDRETMSAQNDLYNELDAQAAAAAANVSTNPAESLERTIDGLLGENVAHYTSERQKAGNADAVLREYLGSAE